MGDETRWEHEPRWEQIEIGCECGRTMKVRINRSNGSRFMGCTGWPVHCQRTAEIPHYLILRAQGAPELPGFGG